MSVHTEHPSRLALDRHALTPEPKLAAHLADCAACTDYVARARTENERIASARAMLAMIEAKNTHAGILAKLDAAPAV